MSSINQFNVKNRGYSSFDLSHKHITSYDMGKLFPISCKVVLPGDKLKLSVDAFTRGASTVLPIMDNINLKVNHFYVPFRVLWGKFEEFYTKSQNHILEGLDPPTMPTVWNTLNEREDDNYPCGRLADYLGVSKYYGRTGTQVPEAISAMPFLAYHKIFLDYYAPQRWVEYLTSSGTAHPLMQLKKKLHDVKIGNGGNLPYTLGGITENDWLGQMHNVGWNHDYFTNALPTPTLFDDAKLKLVKDGGELFSTINSFDPNHPVLSFMGTDFYATANKNALATVRDLRQSIASQHYLEMMHYGGGRYMETLKVFWDQEIDNRTLQRSEYIGGDVFQMFVNEVESTAETDGRPLGDVAGKPVGAGSGAHEYYEADEFGIYMCMAHLVPRRSYSDAMDKALFFTNTVDELPNPEFEGIGDEAVFLYELNGKSFQTGDISDAFKVFGYVPRYSNYKTSLDRFSGEMRGSLKQWHMGTTAEELEPFTQIVPEFIECHPREDIFNVPGESDKFYGTFKINIDVKRKLGVNPMPGVSYI